MIVHGPVSIIVVDQSPFLAENRKIVVTLYIIMKIVSEFQKAI